MRNQFKTTLSAGAPDKLIHVYGPTENTTFSTAFEVRQVLANDETIPIGRAIRGRRAVVVDQNLIRVSAGEVGELMLAGIGLARGYRNSPEQTDERFVMVSQDISADGLAYRTGDKVLVRQDGELEFVGRLDRQIKLRGHRIEPPEIELAINSFPPIAVCHVTVQRGALTAYVSPHGHVAQEMSDAYLVAQLAEWLAQRLPAYLCPSRIIAVKRLPLNANGKLDLVMLERLSRQADSDHSEASQLPLVSPELDKIQRIWQELIGSRPAPTDRFFDVGGDSIKAIRLAAALEEVFAAKISAREIFAHQTPISQLRLITLGDQPIESVANDIKAASQLPKVFAIHGYWSQCAELMREHCDLTTLAPLGYDGRRIPISLQLMAQVSADKIEAIQPQGPYHLIGYSSGGALAFELAHELLGRGHEVSRLVLLDPTPLRAKPFPTVGAFNDTKRWWKRCDQQLGERGSRSLCLV